ncbi:hypothetical protein Taro_028574 [Colocasia esculenta]|uniref:Uncharacterized protein n=1 Tax=Colocasia esculenta TaxID=4460 RepID=A0A843VXM5_COLES|nr:hypothetical protein [Colocasia esculenta]
MEPSGSYGADIFEFYARYCDIMSRNDHRGLREALSALAKSLESRGHIGYTIFTWKLNLVITLCSLAVAQGFNRNYEFESFGQILVLRIETGLSLGSSISTISALTFTSKGVK